VLSKRGGEALTQHSEAIVMLDASWRTGFFAVATSLFISSMSRSIVSNFCSYADALNKFHLQFLVIDFFIEIEEKSFYGAMRSINGWSKSNAHHPSWLEWPRKALMA
jgi:hypothetical protein